MLSPLLVIWVHKMLFSSIRFLNYLFNYSTLSSFLITVSKTYPLVRLFLTSLVFYSLAFLNLTWSSWSLDLNLMFSLSSWLENFYLYSTNLPYTKSNLFLKFWFSCCWCSMSLFLTNISLVNSSSSCSFISSGI